MVGVGGHVCAPPPPRQEIRGKKDAFTEMVTVRNMGAVGGGGGVLISNPTPVELN